MATRPKIIRSEKALRKQVDAWRGNGKTIGLVPTMGALHQGHLSLVEYISKKADRVLVTIFVNPSQFAAHEDLDTYPRNEKADVAMLAALGVDMVYTPSVRTMYPDGFATSVNLKGPATVGLEDKYRPHFFGGVATVVAKLLIQCNPHIAIFGEKDYQQLMVITRMARDLNIPVKIIGGKTIREPDGLALSSRNAYLNEKERTVAPTLQAALKEVATKISGNADINRALSAAKTRISQAGFDLDYLEARNAKTLQPLEKQKENEPIRLLVAAKLGTTRLIDNIAVKRKK
ncbi:MAG: pantoate--beta-alanine ligase [Fimbriimonadaceae bacterium]|nr:pantoate--beta-alanine ligase [Alphaproteobacteria bacterium]